VADAPSSAGEPSVGGIVESGLAGVVGTVELSGLLQHIDEPANLVVEHLLGDLAVLLADQHPLLGEPALLLLAGGAGHGGCPVQRCAISPHRVLGFNQFDPGRI
jgi:hypothetical protein